MFDSLVSKLDNALRLLKGQVHITEANISTTIKEIRKALLDADVQYKIAKEFTEKIKEKALGQQIIKTVSPGQMMVKIMEDELTSLMGSTTATLNTNGNPAIIMVVGLQGSGKTTFCAKLANYLKNQGKSSMLIAGDIYRPAAADQLEVLAQSIEVPLYRKHEEITVVDIVKNGLKEAKLNNKNIVILDTAGRLAVDEKMMQEVDDLKKTLNPTEIIFALDSMNGQDAVNTAKTFFDRLSFTGVVLTKLDSDTRGGAALAVSYTLGTPIKFVSIGEKVQDLDVFHPDRMARRILGMGDIVSLVEKAQSQISEEEAKKLEKKIKKAQFDFNDFKQQIQEIKKMGDLKNLLGMIPGIGKQMKNIDIDDNAFVKIEAIINSMTPKERSNPDLLDNNRKQRIAKGCGQNIESVNAFIKQFDQMKNMMKNMSNMKMPPMMGGLGGGFPNMKK